MKAARYPWRPHHFALLQMALLVVLLTSNEKWGMAMQSGWWGPYCLAIGFCVTSLLAGKSQDLGHWGAMLLSFVSFACGLFTLGIALRMGDTALLHGVGRPAEFVASYNSGLAFFALSGFANLILGIKTWDYLGTLPWMKKEFEPQEQAVSTNPATPQSPRE